jgi:hypothetical protein
MISATLVRPKLPGAGSRAWINLRALLRYDGWLTTPSACLHIVKAFMTFRWHRKPSYATCPRFRPQ